MYLLVGQRHSSVPISNTLLIQQSGRKPHFWTVLRAPSCRATPNWSGTILISWACHIFLQNKKSINQPNIIVSSQPQCLPSALVKYIVGSAPAASELAISSSRLHGAYRRVAASSLLLVNIEATCINSHITSNKYFWENR